MWSVYRKLKYTWLKITYKLRLKAQSIFQLSPFHQKVLYSDRRLQVNFLCQAILLSGRKRLFLSFSPKCDKIHKVPKEKQVSRHQEYVFLVTFSEYREAEQSDGCLSPSRSAIHLICCALADLPGLGHCVFRFRKNRLKQHQRAGVLWHRRSPG